MMKIFTKILLVMGILIGSPSNVVSADTNKKIKTCKQVAKEWNVNDMAALSDRINMSKGTIKMMGIKLPVTVPPKGCSMILEGGMGIKFGEAGKIKPYCNDILLTKGSCTLVNFSIRTK